MVQGRHAEDALARQLEGGHLDDHGQAFEHEYATDDGQQLSGWALEAQNPRAHIVYFHGNGGNLSIWAPILAGVARQGYSVVDGQRFDWKQFDTLAVPGGSWCEHVNTSDKDPVLLSGTVRDLFDVQDEIAQARADWEEGNRFGTVAAYNGPRLNAPSLLRFARPNPVS